MRKYADARGESARNRKQSRAIFTPIPMSIENEAVLRSSKPETPTDIPWNMLWLSSKQANERQLTTLRRVAEAHGLNYNQVRHWTRCSNVRFPDPVATLKETDSTSGHPRLFHASELVAWLRKQIASR